MAIVFPITAFVAAGFEHSVANMYFIPMGLMIKGFADPQFWSTTGISTVQVDPLTWGNYLINNLVPVTIGNIVGGSVFVGGAYWFLYLRKNPKTV
jgi:formate transporter